MQRWIDVTRVSLLCRYIRVRLCASNSILPLGCVWIVFSIIICNSVCAAYQGCNYKLGSAPYKVESMPISINSARILQQTLLTESLRGETHLLLAYAGQGSFQLMDANLSAGTVRVVDGVAGKPGPNAGVLHPNGKYYVASSDPGFLMEYDLHTGETRQIHRLADKGAQWMDMGDDGAIYIGEHVTGRVERFDPTSGTWEDFGIMDDPGPPYYRYAYTLGSDGRYVYIGVGKNPWYLVIYDRQTRTSKTFWKSLKQGEVFVCKGLQGGWFVSVGGIGWFKLERGSPVPQATSPEIVPNHMRGGVCTGENLSLCGSAYEVDLGLAVPVATTEGTAVAEIRYRVAGAPEWRSVKAPVPVLPQTIKQLVAWEGEELLGLTSMYGPLFRLSHARNGGIKLLGSTFRSNYDALYLPDRALWYIAGYPGSTLVYDPKHEWSLLPGSSPSDISLNPHIAGQGIAKHHYYLARGADGLVYAGVHHERESTGGDLGWYDPASGSTGHLREPFVHYDVRDLKAVLGGNALVYSSNALTEADGSRPDAVLFVLDVAAKQVVREIVPLPGVSDLDKVIETSPGVIVGVAGTECYAVDIQSGKVLYHKSLGAQFGTAASPDRRLVLGPDGYVWLVLVPPTKDALPQLARIKPVDGSVEIVQGVPGLVNFVLVPGRGVGEYDALLYGGTDIRRVRALLVQAIDDSSR